MIHTTKLKRWNEILRIVWGFSFSFQWFQQHIIFYFKYPLVNYVWSLIHKFQPFNYLNIFNQYHHYIEIDFWLFDATSFCMVRKDRILVCQNHLYKFGPTTWLAFKLNPNWVEHRVIGFDQWYCFLRILFQLYSISKLRSYIYQQYFILFSILKILALKSHLQIFEMVDEHLYSSNFKLYNQLLK